MQDQPDGGSIIMIGSVSGTRPSPGTAAYGAAKAGLQHLVTSLAIEWAPRVRLNCVVPGLRRDRRQHGHYGDAQIAAAVGRDSAAAADGDPGRHRSRVHVPGLPALPT